MELEETECEATYRRWLAAVSSIIDRRVGCSLADLPDPMVEGGLWEMACHFSPQESANMILAEAGFED